MMPDGVVADLGGGSLELIDVKGTRVGKGITLPLGGLSLMDASNQSPKAAVKIVREALGKAKILDKPARPHALCRGRHLAGAGRDSICASAIIS